MSAKIRPATADDIDACSGILYHAFKDIADHHRFPPDLPTMEAATQLTLSFISHPSIFSVVAENGGRVIGSNHLDERGRIRGLGPISVDPAFQKLGFGRQLMEAVLERGRDSDGIRLLQDSYNMLTVCLYASLGFKVKEPTLLMAGRPKKKPPSTVEVRPLKDEDLDECSSLCTKVHGFDRTAELKDALEAFSPFVILRKGRIRGYASILTYWAVNHAVAETDEDMKNLILGVATACPEPLSFLLPTRQDSLFRWCLDVGFRALKPMTLMAKGEYMRPDGCYLPSVFC